MLYALALCLHK